LERKKVQAFKGELLKQRDLVEEEIRLMEEWGLDESLKESTGELSSYDNFSGDISDITFERSKDLALRDNTRIIGEKIEGALEQMREGKYGVCAVCGKTIPEERLEAVPYATLCVECQSIVDREGGDSRPIEEEVFPFAFGNINNDHDIDNQIITDGEDTWEELERYGSANSPQDITGVSDYEDIDTAADDEAGIVDYMDRVTNEEYEDTFR